MNSYKQAEKSYDDARRYDALSGKMQARILGWNVSNMYKDPNGDYRGKVTPAYPRTLKTSDVDMLKKAKARYTRMSQESDLKSRELRRQGDSQNGFANSEAKRILRAMKNPSAKELAEFYLDTTVAKAKKSATKAMSTAKKSARKAKKYATEAMSTAEKYATKAISTAEKSARKAKKYATKTIKSVVR